MLRSTFSKKSGSKGSWCEAGLASMTAAWMALAPASHWSLGGALDSADATPTAHLVVSAGATALPMPW